MIDKPSLTFIRSFLHKNGRLLWGAVFFICLAGIYGYKQGYWDFIVENGNVQQGDFAPATIGSNRDKERNRKKTDNTDNTDNIDNTDNAKGDMKLIKSVANIERGLPLRDPFIPSYTLADAERVLAEGNKASQQANGNTKKQEELFVNSMGSNSSHQSRNVESHTSEQRTHPSIHVLGVIMGNSPQAIIVVGNKEGIYSVGELINEVGYNVLDINSNGVYLSQEGISKWYGVE